MQKETKEEEKFGRWKNNEKKTDTLTISYAKHVSYIHFSCVRSYCFPTKINHNLIHGKHTHATTQKSSSIPNVYEAKIVLISLKVDWVYVRACVCVFKLAKEW